MHSVDTTEHHPVTDDRLHRILRFLPTVAVVVAMRAKFIGPPFLADEGGYLAIARAWGRGATLYRDVWIDRPQGLVVIFRALWTLGLGSATGVRLLGLAACLLLAAACGSIAASLAGERARPYAAFAVGVLTSVPQLEGFAVNGELLGSAVGACCLALTLRAVWRQPEPDTRLLAVAGALAVGAMSIKQSGFDAPAAAAFVIVVAGFRLRWPRTTTRRVALHAASGGAAVAIALATHGAITGWHRWWYAIVGYRLDNRSALTGANWEQFHRTWSIASPVLVPVAVLVVGLALAAAATSRVSWDAAVPVVWGAASTVAFFLGGLFHRHYWLLLMPPLGTALAALAARWRWTVIPVAASVIAVFAPLRLTMDSLDGSRVAALMRVTGDSRPVLQAPIASWFATHAGPDDQMYVMCFGADVYGAIDADPPYPYLWYLNIRDIDGAVDQMVDMLTGARAPRFVVQYQSPQTCDPTGAVASALDQHYRAVAVVAGVTVFERTSSPP